MRKLYCDEIWWNQLSEQDKAQYIEWAKSLGVEEDSPEFVDRNPHSGLSCATYVGGLDEFEIEDFF